MILYDDLIKELATDNKAMVHKPVNLGASISDYMAYDSVHKLDAQFFYGVDNCADAGLKSILDRANFRTLRQEAGEHLSRYGLVFAVWIYINNQWDIQFLDVVSYTAHKRVLHSIEARGLPIRNNLQKNQLVHYSFSVQKDKKGNNQPIVGKAYYVGDSGEKTYDSTKDLIYPQNVTVVPGAIIQNNFNATPDWQPIGAILEEISILSNAVGVEWENIKTMFNNRAGVFGRGQTSTEIEKKIATGKTRVLSMTGYNSKFGAPLETFMSGSTTPDILIRTLAFLEDRAMKYSFFNRDFDSTATNKHNLQVSLFAQSAGERLQIKKEQRQRDYRYFFNLGMELGIFTLPIDRVTIGRTEFEKGKIEGMRIAGAQRELYEAQAKAQVAQANTQKVSAEMMKKNNFNPQQGQNNNDQTRST